MEGRDKTLETIKKDGILTNILKLRTKQIDGFQRNRTSREK